MYTIMRNIFINNYRKIVRDQTFVDTTDNYYHLNLPQDSGFESTEGAYDLKEMHRIVNSLPRDYKVPFSMHVSGFKYREIAEKLNLPLGTVKSRIFFTRQKLQEELKQRTVEVTVGGGALTIVMNGEKNVESVKINDKNVIDPEDTEMLEDLIVAGVNEASKKVDDLMAQEMSKITGGMKLPGMF